MKTRSFFHLIPVLALALAPCLSRAETGCPSAGKAAKATPASVSTFQVPGLDKSVTKKLVKELSKLPGILSAKAAPDSGSLSVAFEPSKISAKNIGEVLAGLAPGTKLTGTGTAEVPPASSGTSCGACPHRSGCPSSGK